MKKIVPFLAALAAAAILPLHAQVSVDALKAELAKKLPPGTPPIESVKKTPYGNLYEVLAGGEIIYTDDKASFILVGPIIDLNTKTNVTEQRMAQLNAIDFKSLPLDRAIKIVRGDGSRKLALFEDPNCGYCKRFERDFQGVNNVTAYVFLYPILAPDSVDKSKAIWCSANPGKAWIDTMVHDRLPASAGKCEAPLEQNLAFGHDKHIRGTPTLIFEDGERIPGAVTMPELEKRFAEAKSKLAQK